MYKRATYVGIIATILAVGIIFLFEPTTKDLLYYMLVGVIAYVTFELFLTESDTNAEVETKKENPIKRKENKKYDTSSFSPKVLLETHGSNQHIKDVRLGVNITGASGSGKTESPCYALAKHFAQYQCPGVIHDFKSGELTEIVYPLFKDTDVSFHIFSPIDWNRSVRINPIAPEYIQSEIQLTPIITSFIQNLTGKISSSEAGDYFAKGAASLISAVIWRFKEDFPEKCSWPYVVAFLLAGEHDILGSKVANERLIDFIKESTDAELLGAQFLRSVKNEKEIGSLFGTICSSLSKLVDPVFFYLLSENELSLALNDPSNKSVLSFINTPGVEQSAISPILGTLLECCFQQMSVRHRPQSFIMIDEAPRLKMLDLESRVNTLRSYKVSFTYIMQDIIQAKTQNEGKDYYTKGVQAGLSTQLFGKTNDPISGEYYEKYFPIIQQKTKSKSYAALDLSGSDSRETVGEKDRREVRGFEFFNLKVGQFYLFTGGKHKKIRFKDNSKTMVKELPPPIRSITPEELRAFKTNIVQNAKTCFYQHLL